MNTWLLIILCFLGYITCGYLFSLLNRLVDRKEDYIPVAAWITLFPIILFFYTIGKVVDCGDFILKSVEKSSQEREYRREVTKGLNIKTVRKFIAQNNPIHLQDWKEVELAKWLEKNVKEKSGYKFNKDDSFVFSFENGEIKVTISEFLVLGYYDFPEAFWEEFVILAKK